LRRSSRAKAPLSHTTYVVDDDDDDQTNVAAGASRGKLAQNLSQHVWLTWWMTAPVAALFLPKSERDKLKKSKKKKGPIRLPSPRKDAPPAGLFLSKAERLKQQADKSRQV
jgi:hypothetical protein